MASTMATRLRAMEKARLRRMVVIIRQGQGQQVGQLLYPVIDQNDVGGVHGDITAHAPMAMPTKALSGRGASLMPSPTMQIRTPACWAGRSS